MMTRSAQISFEVVRSSFEVVSAPEMTRKPEKPSIVRRTVSVRQAVATIGSRVRQISRIPVASGIDRVGRGSVYDDGSHLDDNAGVVGSFNYVCFGQRKSAQNQCSCQQNCYKPLCSKHFKVPPAEILNQYLKKYNSKSLKYSIKPDNFIAIEKGERYFVRPIVYG